MDSVAFAFGVLAVIVGWNVFFYKQTGGRILSPLWIAFGTTTGAALYLGAGTIGYILDRHDRFVAHTAWAGRVIWPEIATGLLMAIAAAYFWRKGLRSIGARH